MTESLSMPFCHSWTQDRPGSLLGSVLLGTGPGRRETSQPRAKDPGRLFPTPARSLPCSRPRPLPAALQASTNRRRKEPGVCLRGAGRRRLGGGLIRLCRITSLVRRMGGVWTGCGAKYPTPSPPHPAPGVAATTFCSGGVGGGMGGLMCSK